MLIVYNKLFFCVCVTEGLINRVYQGPAAITLSIGDKLGLLLGDSLKVQATIDLVACRTLCPCAKCLSIILTVTLAGTPWCRVQR